MRFWRKRVAPPDLGDIRPAKFNDITLTGLAEYEEEFALDSADTHRVLNEVFRSPAGRKLLGHWIAKNLIPEVKQPKTLVVSAPEQAFEYGVTVGRQQFIRSILNRVFPHTNQ